MNGGGALWLFAGDERGGDDCGRRAGAQQFLVTCEAQIEYADLDSFAGAANLMPQLGPRPVDALAHHRIIARLSLDRDAYPDDMIQLGKPRKDCARVLLCSRR